MTSNPSLLPAITRVFIEALPLASLFLTLLSCTHSPHSPYESATPAARAHFKQVRLPLPDGTPFKISQGAFGKHTHHDPGHEYTWDFDVPLGTPIVSVEDGTVLQIWAPPGPGGGCDPKFSDSAHNIKIRHRDGTVAQYVHVDARVSKGDSVRKGQPIAVTARNGYLCTPQLDFGIYQDDQHLYGSGQTRTIPLRFEGLPGDSLAREGYEHSVSELDKALPLLIKEWDRDAYYRHPMQPFPKRVEFKARNGHRLTFVATKHKAVVASREAIDLALQDSAPDILLIEGIHADWGTSPRRWDQDLEARLNEEGYECYHAYKRAVERGIPFVGSELPGKMSDYTSYQRDVALIKLIWDLMTRHHQVTVVYGAGHYVQTEAALKRLFGSPVTQLSSP